MNIEKFISFYYVETAYFVEIIFNKSNNLTLKNLILNKFAITQVTAREIITSNYKYNTQKKSNDYKIGIFYFFSLRKIIYFIRTIFNKSNNNLTLKISILNKFAITRV